MIMNKLRSWLWPKLFDLSLKVMPPGDSIAIDYQKPLHKLMYTGHKDIWYRHTSNPRNEECPLVSPRSQKHG